MFSASNMDRCVYLHCFLLAIQPFAFVRSGSERPRLSLLPFRLSLSFSLVWR